MNDYLIKFKNQIKSIISFKKINSHKHWSNLLYVFFTITIILIIFSLYLLLAIKKEQEFLITPNYTGAPNLINEKLNKKVTEYFDQKLQKENEIKDGIKTYIDPSL